jgi:hypothetical protein
MAVINHVYFNHHYTSFRNVITEWFALSVMIVFNFWRFRDVKSYHIFHHSQWPTLSDPTAGEIAQGKFRYYVGLTDPVAIPLVSTKESSSFDFASRHYYSLKAFSLLMILVLFGFSGVFYGILMVYFYTYVLAKIHDMLFHSSLNEQDKVWLFPIYFNDAWHIEHHSDYKQQYWHWRYINPQYWCSVCLFKI